MREKLLSLNEKWFDLTKIALIKDMAHESEKEMSKVHNNIEKVLDEMYKTTLKLRMLGDDNWVNEFKKKQENKMRGH